LFHPNFVGKIPFFSDGESNANLGYLQQLIFVAALVYIVTYPGWWFQPTPLKNMTLSVGMMTLPTVWKNDPHVPNHQPVFVGEIEICLV
jgi:hypothetical protein